jgi:regulator of replication initiation timing
MAVIGHNPSHRNKGDNIPVYRVNWNNSNNFAQKVTELERNANRLNPNWKYDLPSITEWQYACRAGTTTNWYWGDEFNASLVSARVEVGSCPPNSWGFHDMFGSVMEFSRNLDKRMRCWVVGIKTGVSVKGNPTKLNNGGNLGDRGIRLVLRKTGEGSNYPYKPAPDVTPPKTGPGDAPDLKCKETIAKLEQEIKNQKIEITDLNILIIELRKQVADLNSSNLALTTEVSGLKNQVSNLNGQVASLTTENGELKEQVTNLREDNGNLQVTVTSLNEQLVEADRIAKTPFVHDWIYTPDHGWLHIDPQNFPIIYKNDTQTWHFYEQGSINPRYFYNFKEQKWEAWDPNE